MPTVSELLAGRSVVVRDQRHAVRGVQKSLWSGLQARGFTGREAGALAWTLIRAGSPGMTGHAQALQELRDAPAGDLAFLRDTVRKLALSRPNADSPFRASICSDIVNAIERCLGEKVGDVGEYRAV